MQIINWTEEFSIGNEIIDQQHKELINMINHLITNPGTTTESETVSDVLSDMIQYAKEHFATEEKLMRDYNYPALEEHIAEHESFWATTTELCTEVMEGTKSVPEEILVYLSDWLVDHILVSDMAIKPYLSNKDN